MVTILILEKIISLSSEDAIKRTRRFRFEMRDRNSQQTARVLARMFITRRKSCPRRVILQNALFFPIVENLLSERRSLIIIIVVIIFISTSCCWNVRFNIKREHVPAAFRDVDFRVIRGDVIRRILDDELRRKKFSVSARGRERRAKFDGERWCRRADVDVEIRRMRCGKARTKNDAGV